VIDMRVLFICHVSNMLGAARSLLDLMDGLVQRGVNCYVIIPRSGKIIQELEERNIVYRIVPFKNWLSSDSPLWKRLGRGGLNLLAMIRVAIKARAWGADVLYTNSSVTPVGAFAAFLLKKIHIWHIREFGQEDYGLSFDLGTRLSMKIINQLSFNIIIISEALKQKYVQYVSPAKIRRIYDAVHFPSGRNPSSEVKQRWSQSNILTLVIIGLLHPGKGQMDAVLAVGNLARQGVAVKLKIVGGGNPGYIKQLKQTVIRNGVEGYVEFTGYVDDPAPIMNSADIILICSRSEAFGRVTIEGMLCGKPIIGTRSGATPEFIKEGFNGLLYEPGNHRDLAQKIKYLLDHPGEAKQMGTNGFEWASKEFTIEKCASQVFDVLQEAVQRKCQ